MIDTNIGFGLYALERDGLIQTRQGKLNAIIKQAKQRPIDLMAALEQAKLLPLTDKEIDYVNDRL